MKRKNWKIRELEIGKIKKFHLISNIQPLISKRGFTLIELLIVIAMIGVLVGISVPSLITFNRSQQLKAAAAEVKSALRFAQNKALAAEIDSGECTQIYSGGNRLLGWYVHFPGNGGSTFYIAGRCAPNKNFGQRDFDFPKDIKFQGSEIVALFGPTTEGVSFYKNVDLENPANKLAANSITVSITNRFGDTAQAVVNLAGEIK